MANSLSSTSFPDNVLVAKGILPFLDLPVEMQVEIVNYITQPSDLQALCLICKEVSDIATPRLYHRIDLNPTNILQAKISGSVIQTALGRIRALLRASHNLKFVRILRTAVPGSRIAEAMDGVLPKLRKDYLLEFTGSASGKKDFPTRKQLHFLWSTQRNLRNLLLTPQYLGILEDFLTQKQLQPSQLLSSVTKLALHPKKDSAAPETVCRGLMHWSQENLDLSQLRTLCIFKSLDDYTSSKLQSLFRNRSFVNLTRIHFQSVSFQKTVELVNLPSLKYMELWNCTHPPNTPSLVLPQAFPLRNLYVISDRAKEMIPLLAQIKGLETLILRVVGNELNCWAGRLTQRQLAREIEGHKATLRELRFYQCLNEDNWLGGSDFMRRILECKQLYRLSLPQFDRPYHSYAHIIQQLPQLKGLIMYDCGTCIPKKTSHYFAKNVMASLSASSELALISFNHKTRSHGQDMEDCFVRRGMGLPCLQEYLRDLSFQLGEEEPSIPIPSKDIEWVKESIFSSA